MLRAAPWRYVAVALWLLWALHLYFDAYLFRCMAVFFLALLSTIAALALTVLNGGL